MSVFGYSKKQRLCSRKDIVALVDGGKAVFRHPFKVHCLPNKCGYSRFAISVPKKSFKRAVVRNLIKRRTKEAIRLNVKACLECDNFDFLFVYVAKEVVDYARIEEKVKEIFSEVASKKDEGDI